LIGVKVGPKYFIADNVERYVPRVTGHGEQNGRRAAAIHVAALHDDIGRMAEQPIHFSVGQVEREAASKAGQAGVNVFLIVAVQIGAPHFEIFGPIDFSGSEVKSDAVRIERAGDEGFDRAAAYRAALNAVCIGGPSNRAFGWRYPLQ